MEQEEIVEKEEGIVAIETEIEAVVAEVTSSIISSTIGKGTC